jgi:hypothetical protein
MDGLSLRLDQKMGQGHVQYQKKRGCGAIIERFEGIKVISVQTEPAEKLSF